MDKKQFKEFCKNEFMKKGFKKNKNTFYNDRNYKWIYEIDFDNIEKDNLRKIRKGIGKCLRKLRIIRDKC